MRGWCTIISLRLKVIEGKITPTRDKTWSQSVYRRLWRKWSAGLVPRASCDVSHQDSLGAGPACCDQEPRLEERFWVSWGVPFPCSLWPTCSKDPGWPGRPSAQYPAGSHAAGPNLSAGPAEAALCMVSQSHKGATPKTVEAGTGVELSS